MEKLATDKLAPLIISIHVQPLQVLLIIVVQVRHGRCRATNRRRCCLPLLVGACCCGVWHASCADAAYKGVDSQHELVKVRAAPAQDSGGRNHHKRQQVRMKRRGHVLKQLGWSSAS